VHYPTISDLAPADLAYEWIDGVYFCMMSYLMLDILSSYRLEIVDGRKPQQGYIKRDKHKLW
jgi:hypothetical protein